MQFVSNFEICKLIFKSMSKTIETGIWLMLKILQGNSMKTKKITETTLGSWRLSSCKILKTSFPFNNIKQ